MQKINTETYLKKKRKQKKNMRKTVKETLQKMKRTS